MSTLHKRWIDVFNNGGRLIAIGSMLAACLSIISVTPCGAQTCIQLRGQSYSQNFDSLPLSGTSHSVTTLPFGFSFVETGSGANTTYAADSGGTATSNTYSYGEAGDTDRALGELTGLTVRSFCGVCFVNNTGVTIPSFTVSFEGEQWRLGSEDAVIDRLDFQYSKTATSPGDNTAAWTNVDALDFYTPSNVGVGAKDGNDSDNRQKFSPTTILPAGGIPQGGRLYLRWAGLDIAGVDDGLAIDDFKLTYSPSADFNLDGMVNGTDLLALQRGFGTTSGATTAMGDANKDGAVNGADITIWRSQFGAFTPGASAIVVEGFGVPEPASIVLTSIVAACFAGWRRNRQRPRAATWAVLLAAAAWLGTLNGSATAATVSLSLNVFPTSNANPNSGGAWTLVAKSSSANGIAGIDAFLTGINPSSVIYGTGINAATTNGAPYVSGGTPSELVYFQDLGLPGVVVGVGTATVSPGVDPLGNPAWDNASIIAFGNYTGAMPTFAANSGTKKTAANILTTSTSPFIHADNATTTFVSRRALTGDYDLNGRVDIADYVIWRNNMGTTNKLRNDFTPGVGTDDHARWKANLGTTLPTGASVMTGAVPEPSTLVLCMLALAAGWAGRRAK